jgi:O-antigen/teichoic acid export membrane protein
MGLAIAGQSLSELFHALFQKHERFDMISHSLVLRGLLCLAGVGSVFYATQNVLLSLIAMMVLRFLVVLVYDFPMARRLWGSRSVFRLPKHLIPRFSRTTLVAMTWLGLPLAVNMGVLSLTPQIPRFWLEKQMGLAALGQFVSIAMLMSVGLMILNSLGVAMSQRFAQTYAAGNRREFVRLTTILVISAFGMGGLGLLVIPWCGGMILTMAYTSEYAPLTDLFWLITFGATFGFIGNALGYPITAARRFRIQPVLCLIQAVITMAGCAILVPKYDMIGAAWAVAAANIVYAGLFALVWFVVCKKCRSHSRQ